MDSRDVVDHFQANHDTIEKRISGFEQLKDAEDYRLFMELCFVILTSQSSAKNCWEAVKELDERDLLLNGNKNQISKVLARHDVQYEERKSSYITENRNILSQPTLTDPTNELKLGEKLDEDLEKARNWLAGNLKGVSWKGASHFLRNIDRGDPAIISGHILKKLHALGVIDSVERPDSYSDYRDMERKMERFADEIGLTVTELDLTLWSMETGDVFK
ncbi:MAG: hypothetical protein ABEJ99_05180 [Candidatus Nanohaloarchaea archaeon]